MILDLFTDTPVVNGEPERLAPGAKLLRGLAAPAMVWASGTFDVVFDLAEHKLDIATSDGRADSFALVPMAVADFYSEVMGRLRRLGIEVRIWTMPRADGPDCQIASSAVGAHMTETAIIVWGWSRIPGR